MSSKSERNKAQDKSNPAQSEAAKSQPSRAMSTGSGRSLSPFGGFSSMNMFRDEFNRLFDRLAPNWFGGSEGMGMSSWGFDVREEDNEITVRAEAPGFEAQDFDIQVRDNRLTMCACHKSESEEDEGGHHWSRQEFHQSVMLPSGVDPEHVEASYQHGVLSVKIPKTEQSHGKQIEVKG